MNTLALAFALALQAPPGTTPQPAATPAPAVIEVATSRAAVNTFDSLWAAYQAARTSGEAEAVAKRLAEIRRLRIERNIRSLEDIALARVAEGLDALGRDDRDGAEQAFQDAIALDPHLPDGYFGVALSAAKRGPAGYVTALRQSVTGTSSRLATTRGWIAFLALLIPAVVVAWIGAAFVVGAAMMVRYGGLLLHDIDEALGPRNARAVAVAAFGLLVALPVVALQGWAWLPFWWLALLFIYMTPVERTVVGVLVGAMILVGPFARMLEDRLVALQNPLFRASLLTVEGGPDTRAILELEEATKAYPEDKDFAYLLARQYKMFGRYADAANVYKALLQKEPGDLYALNNLANIEFANLEYPVAIARYKQGIDAGGPGPVVATLYYNTSVAHLMKVEFEPGQAARAEADKLASSLTKRYDETWKYENGNAAAVDLGLDSREVQAKFFGMREGVARPNVIGTGAAPSAFANAGRAVVNRFVAFLAVFGLAIAGLQKVRGPKMFTMRCGKCGTAFCRQCHLGAATAGLCTQCYHLYVVRDGVSGPARMQKQQEVAREEDRRSKTFRLLSLLLPGAGHVYARKPIPGLLFALAWCALLALAVLGGRVLPLTDASSALTKPWGLAVVAGLLLVIYGLVIRSRPSFEMALPGPAARRGQTQTRRRAAS